MQTMFSHIKAPSGRMGQQEPFTRVTLLPRMLAGFSGKKIASPKLVWAMLYLGNSAAILRVGTLLALSLLIHFGSMGRVLDNMLFGFSGIVGLAFAICLLINLWPTLPRGSTTR